MKVTRANRISMMSAPVSGMRSLIKILSVILFLGHLSADQGPWPQILSSIGFTADSTVSAQIHIGRPGSPASATWKARLDAGAFLILEGESPLAASFGFRPTKETVQLTSIQDVHRPKLPI